MKLRKLLSILITLSLLAGLLPLAALPAAAVEVSDWDALRAALNAGGEAVLATNIAAPGGAQPLSVADGVTVTLDLHGHTLYGGGMIPVEGNDALVTIVVTGGDLTLTDNAGDGVLTGANLGVYLTGGTFTMADGVIAGHARSDYEIDADVHVWDAATGHGVYLTGGTFTMEGGVISDNDADGVHAPGGTFTMEGGVIRGNGDDGAEIGGDADMTMEDGVITGNRYGVYAYGGTFTMEDGAITDNDEDGVYVEDGEFFMVGGEIANNEGFGVYVEVGEFDMAGGEITGNYEDGVYAEDGEFDMAGGMIAGNYEDGVHVEDGSFTMSAGEISWNIRAGVYLEGGSFTMSGGEIVENGIDGVWVDGGAFTMSYGEIADNGADGVYVEDGSFTMSDGVIRDNNIDGVELTDGTFTLSGGAITGEICAVRSIEQGRFRLSGAPQLESYGVCDILLSKDAYPIEITGTLEIVIPLRVSFAEIMDMTGDETVAVTSGLSGRGSAEQFVSTAPGWRVTEDGGEAVFQALESVGDWEALSAALSEGRGVILSADVAAPEGAEALSVPADQSAALDLHGYTLDGTNVSDGAAIRVLGTLTLSDADYDGGVLCAAGETVSVTGGTLSLSGNATVRSTESSAVTVGENGRFFLYGGTLTGADFGAVVTGGSRFAMSGGEITLCGDHGLGGGVTISGTNGSPGGRSSMRLSGGSIAGNNATGVSVTDGGGFILSGGEVSRNGTDSLLGPDLGTADGVYVGADGLFYMTGGEIADNYENGVFVEGGRFSQLGGVIRGNMGYLSEAGDYYYGGCGVVVVDGAGMVTGGEIRDNVTGIYLLGGTLDFLNGEISGHAGVDTGEDFFGGYAVYLYGGSCTLYGGTLQGNSVGVGVEGGELTLTGEYAYFYEELTLSGNEECDLYLFDGKTVTVASELYLTDPVRVMTEPLPMIGSCVILTSGLPGNGSVSDFVSAFAGYYIAADNGGEAALYCEDSSYDDGGAQGSGVQKDGETKDGETVAVTWTDVSDEAWYADAAAFAGERNLFEGVVAEGAQVAFVPEAEMDRGEMLRVLWNFAGKPAAEGENPFGDVRSDSFCAEAAAWAAEAGIVNGTGAGFDPEAPITREQLCTMVYRFVQQSGRGFEGLWSFRLDFPDAGEVSDWAREGMSWLVMNGVINGMDGNLNPQGVATRAQVAAVLERLAAVLEAEK